MAKNNKKNNGNFAQNSKSQSLQNSQAKAKRPKEKQYVIEETLEMRLDSCVQKVKDLSELIIGYTPYTLNFVVSNFSGTTNKPSKVSAFANAVVGIILADGQSSFSHIGSILGLNVDIDLAERKMLENAIKNAKYFREEAKKNLAAKTAEYIQASNDYQKTMIEVSRVEPDPEEPKRWVGFKALLSNTTAAELKEFFDARNIDFRPIKIYEEDK